MNMMTREIAYLLACVSAVIHQSETPQPPKDLDWIALGRLSAKHSVGNILCYALEQLDCVPEDVMAKLQELKNKAILREATQELELQRVRERFTEGNIKFMPLKGVFMKALYPKPDMRTMGDIDILFDPTRAHDVEMIMTDLGYDLLERGIESKVDVYWKKPIMNFEMHHILLQRPTCWQAQFEDIWERAVLADAYEYHMTKEDFYLFLVVHFTKHYIGKGIGIRAVLDLWLYRSKHTFDEAYLKKRFEALDLTEFVKNVEDLGKLWFEGGPSSPLLEGMAEFVANNGTYGQVSNAIMVKTKAAETAKREYFLRRAFMPMERMKVLFPILEKAPFLLPFCWVVRWIKVLFRRESLKKEMGLLEKIGNKQAVSLQELHNRAGLKNIFRG